MITKGLTEKEVRNLLGSDGLELFEMKNPEDLHQVIKRYVWMNADGTGISVAFMAEDMTEI
ncbi:hypothetical protein Q5O24_06470 [Eubacteriaceae bacterium ES3]|nr:hypothetical protein Q5O24_06470 [Eubacteriaceae bacterium ES3]